VCQGSARQEKTRRRREVQVSKVSKSKLSRDKLAESQSRRRHARLEVRKSVAQGEASSETKIFCCSSRAIMFDVDTRARYLGYTIEPAILSAFCFHLRKFKRRHTAYESNVVCLNRCLVDKLLPDQIERPTLFISRLESHVEMKSAESQQ